MERTVAVVGAGVGGLAAAAGLIRAGWQVSVLERASAPAADGTALGIWPQAVQALDRLGLGDPLRAMSRRQTSGSLRRPDGTRLVTIDVDRIERWAGEAVHLVARPDLVGLLAGTLPPGTVRYSAPVDAGVLGSLRERFDLVVGADGIASTVRADLPGAAATRPRSTGTVAYRGVARVRVGAGTETWGRGARFGVLPHGGGGERANWYAVLPAGDVHAADDDLALLWDRFGDWHDPVPRVLERIAVDGHLRHALADLHPHLPTYTDGASLAVLGDAAHAMTPDLGQGACQALLDGLALSDAVGAAGTAPALAAGLTAYDRTRRRPTRRMVSTARTVHRLAQARHGTRLRDAVLRALPV